MGGLRSIRGRPIYPLLVVFPIGLWIVSFGCDIAYYAGTHNLFWKGVAFYSMFWGVVCALVDVVPGVIHYWSLRDRAAKDLAGAHMALNLIVLALFVLNLGIRKNDSTDGEMFTVFLSLFSLGVLWISSWLGGDLVYADHVIDVEPITHGRRVARRYS